MHVISFFHATTQCSQFQDFWSCRKVFPKANPVSELHKDPQRYWILWILGDMFVWPNSLVIFVTSLLKSFQTMMSTERSNSNNSISLTYFNIFFLKENFSHSRLEATWNIYIFMNLCK